MKIECLHVMIAFIRREGSQAVAALHRDFAITLPDE
jgi:hypothetical protein